MRCMIEHSEYQLRLSNTSRLGFMRKLVPSVAPKVITIVLSNRYMHLDMEAKLRISKSIAALARITVLCMFLSNFKCSLVTAAGPPGNETDRLALLAFRERITEDPLQLFRSWNDSIHFCRWTGVSCSAQHPGRVTVLNLQGQRLRGTLPPNIGNLSFLRGINLNGNRFQGEIPREIGRLSRLRHLNISNNVLEGQIPSELSNCTNLEVIHLNYNNLEGDIPVQLGNLPREHLRAFRVSVNNLKGPIPVWLGNLSSLTELSMADNNFEGTIPTGLGRLSNLILLQIAGNNLAGTVPASIYNISSLLYLDIGSNQLHGEIPSTIGSTLPNLRGLYVSENNFEGQIPISLSNASRLLELGFSMNNFTGTVPENLGHLADLERLAISKNQLETVNEDFSFLVSLTNCTKLTALDIGQNRFHGHLPASIANFSDALENLIAGTNNISGPIPEGITNLIGLQRLVLSRNAITGEIPASIGKLENLVEIRLFETRISGSIPSSLGNITKLRRVYMHTSQLEGSIPSSLGNCHELELLRLFNNNLSGIIPNEIVSLPSITLSFNLANNYLTGSLPMGVGNMSSLVELDLSGNRLTGEIPGTIGSCVMLEQLMLQDNLFEGSLPEALGRLSSLHELDLSENRLSGRFPMYLQNLTLLRKLNLSFNNFDGEVPKEGVFSNISEVSVSGNNKLCGGIEALQLPACRYSARKKKVSLILKIAIPVSVCLTLLAVIFTVMRKKNNNRGTSFAMDSFDEVFPRVAYAELSKATDEFSLSNLIGHGSHGSVYKGILGKDRRMVAVKVLNLERREAIKSFKAECEALRTIRHRNLIRIITICSSIDSTGKDFMALVFEFMPNGSLHEWLHNNDLEELKERKLSLSRRLSIANDVASAIEYLHHDCETPIVHGDLKPSNVLLDQDMTARVGDFGLAKLLTDSTNKDSSHGQTGTTGVRGTIGYVPPEYGMGGTASTQGDVFGFGILLLEIFTGKRPTDDMFKDGIDLHEYVKMGLPKIVAEIVDIMELSEDYQNEDRDDDIQEEQLTEADNMVHAKVVECVVAVLGIGLSCSMKVPGDRISMRDAAAELSKIKKGFMDIRTKHKCQDAT